LGSFKETSVLVLKEKFFDYEELIGAAKPEWLKAFRSGDFVVCRLTPDKYHYNHTPVAGMVRDFYENDGSYHSCNPGAVLTLATPYSKNKRVVTILDTDVPGGNFFSPASRPHLGRARPIIVSTPNLTGGNMQEREISGGARKDTGRTQLKNSRRANSLSSPGLQSRNPSLSIMYLINGRARRW
jgi:hypothetical protein